jgi:uncharacterized membrane protein YagU involved in acid resistance
MSTGTTTAPAATLTTPRVVLAGLVGGVVGGVLFGAMMAMQDMLPMVAALIGAQDAAVGFAVHLVISAGAGIAFGVAVTLLPVLAATPVAAVGAGAVYGVIWWVGGALVAMPLMLGMGEMVLAIGDMQVMSLMGHLVFGIATGLVVYLAVRR